MALRLLFLAVGSNRVGAACRVASPLTRDRELAPGCGEDFAKIHLVVVNAPVFVAHPPGTVVAEHVVQLLLETLVVIPSLIFVCELACPFALAPGVADANKLEAVDVPHVKDAVSMIEEDASLTSALSLLSTLVLDHVRAPNQETSSELFLEVLPEHLTLDELCGLWRPKVILLGGATSEVDKCLSH